MIISARIIRKPRKIRKCDQCGGLITSQVLRLFGCAETGDPPYVLYLHPFACVEHYPSPIDNEDTIEALSRWDKNWVTK